MQNVDFISEKWRTVRYTRHLGYVHLAFSIVPLPYIVFYAHLQQISSDYKEMMAAVVVILMALYHICRTIWGLLQLDAFYAWSMDLMKRMAALKMVRAYEWGKKIDSAEVGTWKKLKRKLATLFRKKNSVADCEVDGSKLVGSYELVDESEDVIDKLDWMLRVSNEMVDNELG